MKIETHVLVCGINVLKYRGMDFKTNKGLRKWNLKSIFHFNAKIGKYVLKAEGIFHL